MMLSIAAWDVIVRFGDIMFVLQTSAKSFGLDGESASGVQFQGNTVGCLCARDTVPVTNNCALVQVISIRTSSSHSNMRQPCECDNDQQR